MGRELPPQLVEKKRILPKFLGKHALRKSRNKDDVERAPARVLRTCHQHTPVAALGWLLLKVGQPVLQHVLHFAEWNGSDRPHGPQVATDCTPPIRLAN